MFQGDDGGALVVWRGNSWVQIGVISFFSSSGCGVGQPSGHTRVWYYVSWIQTETGVWF
jgi:secreted trypsin-like serine protease